MANKGVARLGDPGSHGGMIITGANSISVNGRQMARVGDTYACPIHGNNPIASGVQNFLGEGKLVAHVGSLTACGAVIISGSPDTFVDDSFSIHDNLIVLAAAPLANDNVNGYQTQSAAARAALDNANPDSIAANLEYGGLIYRDDNTGRYHYSGPVIGGDQGVNPADAGHPAGTTVVGDYHTHGDYSTAGPAGEAIRTNNPAEDQFNSDHFSRGDMGGIATDAAGNADYRGYLGTPSGNYLEYDPNTRQENPLP